MIQQIQIERGIPVPPVPARVPRSPNACVFCGKQERADGYKTCDQCRRNVKKQRRERMAQGLCEYFGCPDKPKNGHLSCQLHLDRMLAYSNKRRASRQQLQICIDCGKRPQWWTLHCVLCRPGQKNNPLPYGARSALKRYRRFEAIDARRAQAEQVTAAVTDERAKKMLTMRHGLNDGIDRTLEEIGAEFQVTRERVRQIENSTLKELEFAGMDVGLMRQPFKALQRPPTTHRRHLVSDETRKHYRAHALVTKALKAGTLKKKPCGRCGKKQTIAHHPDYDKPLTVEWLCRSHHLQAHGRGDGEAKPKSLGWLGKLKPSREHYDAADIVRTIKACIYKPRQNAIGKDVGITTYYMRRLVRGQRVPNGELIKMLRYIETLKAEKAA